MSLQFKTEREARAFFAQIKRPFPGDGVREAGVAAVEKALFVPSDTEQRSQAYLRQLGLAAVQAALMEGV